MKEYGFEITNRTEVYEKAIADMDERKKDLDLKKLNWILLLEKPSGKSRS